MAVGKCLKLLDQTTFFVSLAYNQMLKLRVYISPEQKEITEPFLKLYEPLSYQGTVTPNRTESRRLKQQTKECRFCKRKKGEVTFKQDTHLISNLLGQNNFYSSDECDACNQYFKEAEGDLAKYLGISRTVDHLRNDVKAPAFESSGGGVRARNLGNDFLWFQNVKPGNGEFNVDLQNGKANISMETQKFKPENVYKALLKMAIGNLPAEEVNSYDAILDFLMNMDSRTGFNHIKRVVVTETELTLARPFGVIFRKRDDISQSELPQFIFCLYCGSLLFQLNIPGYNSRALPAHHATFPVAPYIQLNINDPQPNIIDAVWTEVLSSGTATTNGKKLVMEFPVDNLVGIPLGIDLEKWLGDLDKGRLNR